MKKLVFLLLPFCLQAAKAPDFTVTDYNNKVHKLYSDYLNKEKVVVIKIFFVDCPPCNSIAPLIQPAYSRWGAGTGRVQFFEMSTMPIDVNSYVKTYANKYGITCPSIGSDGGSLPVVAPYKDNKTFGSYYGTPTFLVIAPNGEVNFNVPFGPTNTVSLDTAIAQALRIPSGGSGGGNTCKDSFQIKVLNPNFITHKAVTFDRFNNSNPKYDILNGKYNCEFFYPSSRENYVIGLEAASKKGEDIEFVSTQDIVFLQKFLLRIIPFNNLQYNLADVNGNGSVSASDIAEIRKLILGSISSFKVNRNVGWAYNPKGIDNKGAVSVLVNDLLAQKNNEFAFGKYGDLSGAANPGLMSNQTRSANKISMMLRISQEDDGSYNYEISPDEDLKFIAFQILLKGPENLYYNPSFNLSIDSFGSSNMNIIHRTNKNESEVRMIYCNSKNKTQFVPKNEAIIKFKAKRFVNLNPFFTQEVVALDDQTFDIEYHTELVNNNALNFVQEEDLLRIESNSDIEESGIYNLQTSGAKTIRPGIAVKSLTVSTQDLNPGIYLVRTRMVNGRIDTRKILIYR